MTWNVTGPCWAIGIGEIRNGKAFFMQGRDALLCPKNFAYFLPRFSLTQSEEKNAEVHSSLAIFTEPAPPALPETAMMFIPASWSLPTKADHVAEFLASGTKKLPVTALKKPSYQVEQAKKWVDNNFTRELKIAELAFKLKTNAATLSREFKNESGLTLAEYYQLLNALTQRLAKYEKGTLLKLTQLGL